jgi:HdeA/HdeB family
MGRSIAIAAFLLASASSAHAQVELKNYANADGYIDVQKLTCAQLAGTFQEDADFLGIWYSGWYNGLAKKHAINVPRTKDGIHNVIVYCKENPNKRVIQAIDVFLKAEKNR